MNHVKQVILFIFLIGTTQLYAMKVDLLVLPHSTAGKTIHYFVKVSQCDQNLKETKVEVQVKDGEHFRGLGLLEGVYYGLDDELSSPKFRIQSLKNVTFEYSLHFEKGQCLGKLNFLSSKEESGQLEEMNVVYNHRFGFPTLNKIDLSYKDSNEVKKTTILPYQAKGYFAFYQFGIGLALNLHSNIRPGDTRTFNKSDPVIEPMPTFLIRYGPFFINKDGAGMILLPLKYLVVLGTFLLEGEPYKGTNLRERETSIHFGPLIKSGPLEVLYYKDIEGVGHGEVLKVSLSPEFYPSDEWSINPSVYYQYWDKNYVDYYFGVNQQESTFVGREFKGKEAHNYGFMIKNVLKDHQIQYILSTGFKFYGKDVSNSPIVTKSSEFRFIAGILYDLF